MKQLSSGEHFGENQKTLRLNGTLLSNAKCVESLSVPWHFHENAFFSYQLDGHMEEVNKHSRFMCSKGTLLFHNWQEPHFNTSVSRDSEFFQLEIEERWFRTFDVNPSQIEGTINIQLPSAKLIFNRLFAEFSLNDRVTQLAVDGLLLQSLAELMRVKTQNKDKKPLWVAKVKEKIHFDSGEKITLAVLAKEARLHPTHLSKMFPHYFGRSFGDYARQQQVERSIQLLKDSSLTISDVAYQCHFSDHSHFTRNFKAAMGFTPLQYRKKVLKDAN